MRKVLVILGCMFSLVSYLFSSGKTFNEAETRQEPTYIHKGSRVYTMTYSLESKFKGFGNGQLPSPNKKHVLEIDLFVDWSIMAKSSTLKLKLLPERDLASYESRARFSLKGGDDLFVFTFENGEISEVVASELASVEVRNLMVSLASDIYVDKSLRSQEVALSEGVVTRVFLDKESSANGDDWIYSFSNMRSLSKTGSFKVSGEARYGFSDSSPVAESIAIHRTTEGFLNGLPLFTSEVTVELRENNLSMRQPSTIASHSSSTFQSVHELITAKQEEMIDRKLIRDQDFSQLLDEVIHLDKDVDITGITKTYSRLQAFLKLHPELITDIVGQLESLPLTDRRFGILASLLTTTGTKEAQEALMSSADHLWQDEGKRTILLRKLGFITSPIPDVKEYAFAALARLPESEHAHVRVLSTMGSISFHSRDEAYSTRVYERIQDYMHRHPESTDSAITAMSNMAFEGYLPDAQNLKTSKVEGSRLWGIKLLRRFNQEQSPEVSEMLMESITTDPSPKNRYYAASFLKGDGYSQVGIKNVLKALRSEKSPQVAIQLVRILGEAENKKLAGKVLMDLYRKCGHKKVCQKIEQTLRNI